MKTTQAELANNSETYPQRNAVRFSPAAVSTAFGFRRLPSENLQNFSEFKERLTATLAREFAGLNTRLIRQVVNEADSLAATTPFPALLLPTLAEEKVRSASRWAARQQLIREQTLVLAA